MNIANLAVDKIKEKGESVSIIFEDREITNVQMDICASRLGNALRKLGVGKGDRVILQMPNCPEVLQSFQAVWKLGAVVVPINYLVGEEETAYIYEDSGAEVIISSKNYLSKLQACRARVANVRHVILIEQDSPPEYLSFQELLKGSPDQLPIAEVDDDDLAALIYTAGTTGRPKGVMHTHYSLYSNARMQVESIQLPEGIRSLLVLPLCHSYGISTANNAFLRNVGPAVLLNTFDVDAIFTAIQKYQVNLMTAVPTMYIFMLFHPDPKKYDLSSMKYWISGSAPLTMDTWKGFREMYGFEIIEGWGLTEAGANNSVNPFTGPKKVGSIGFPMKGVEMKIVNDDGKEVPPGQEGEIIIRGPIIMKGYWNKPEETREILKNGWLHTGDVGYKDQEGYYFITERKKDLIIKAGENIAPREIEEVIFTHPMVQEVSVIGIKNSVYGEEIKAYVVLKPNAVATEEEIKEHCLKTLARFKMPKEVAFIAALPKNLIGKVLKKELRKLNA
ncbi:MAG: long-chain fatty acid--CoA ligase [Smithellaceae bacterium]|nr:long-chain fatty acid--CoA ligase [Smithellaceae bacterium]